MPTPLRARLFVGATVGVGCVLFVVAAAKAAAMPLAALAFLAAAVVFTELLEVASPKVALGPDLGSFSFSSAVHIAAALLVGPWGAALVAGFGVLVADGLRRSAWRKIGFNASVFGLAALAGGYAFQLAGGEPGQVALPGDLVPVAALAATYGGLNAVLVCAVIALHTASPFFTIVRSTVQLPATAAEAGLGVSTAVFASTNAWNILALVPLLVVAYQALARLTLLRRETTQALEAFANIIDERDPYTYQHSARVAEDVRRLAEAVGLSSAATARLGWAGRLHDLGKIAVDAAVLRKQGALDDEEWAAMRRHPRLSSRLLRHFSLAADQARAVEYHHERFDGAGYYGIQPGELSIGAHILIVADSFDAMTSDRPYRQGLSREEALAEIERGAGTQFHPLVAKAFIAMERGQSPPEALSADERRALVRLCRSRRRSLPEPRRLLSGRTVALTTAIAGLVAVGLGWLELGAAALTATAGAIALTHLEERRGRQLGAMVRGLLEPPSPARFHLERVARVLGTHAPLRWVGLVEWHQRELDGRLVAEWGDDSARLTAAALSSWFVREVEADDGLLRASGLELGRDGVYVAAPVGDGGSIAGFLVLALERSMPRRVELALRVSLDPLARVLAPVQTTRDEESRELVLVQPGRAAATG
jgi:HD-GYP domain-containing protein (c-di-GMP phosphodiesterase class II)